VCKKKKKAQNPIIQSHVPPLIIESGLDELVVGLYRILFEGTVIARDLPLEFDHVGFLYLSRRR
jgi:hypothetical protein